MEPEAARTVVISRVIDAPAGLLFEAYTKPEHIKKWFGPPGYPVTMVEMDFRVGGTFRFAMTGPDGKQNTPFGGTYRELVRGKKIVYDNGFEEAGAERMVVTVTFDEDKSKKTKLTIHTVFGSIAMRDLHVGYGYEQGTGAGITQLESLAKDLDTRTIVITRVIDAPARLLFDAYAKAEHVMKWFGPPGWPLSKCEMDFRVGGAYHFQMTGPDGTKGPPFGGTYREIVKNERIVYDDAFEVPGAERFVLTVTFEEDEDGKTTLTVNTLFSSAAAKAEHTKLGYVEGSNGAFDQLESLVVSQKGSA